MWGRCLVRMRFKVYFCNTDRHGCTHKRKYSDWNVSSASMHYFDSRRYARLSHLLPHVSPSFSLFTNVPRISVVRVQFSPEQNSKRKMIFHRYFWYNICSVWFYLLQEYTGPGGAEEELDKTAKEEYDIAKWIKKNVPTKKTKFLNHHVEYFTGMRFCMIFQILHRIHSTSKTQNNFIFIGVFEFSSIESVGRINGIEICTRWKMSVPDPWNCYRFPRHNVDA